MIGQRFAGRYSLEQEIGFGSTSRVFLARDEETGRRVAVKVLFAPREGSMAAPYDREVRELTELSHPNIVRVFDVGSTGFEGFETSCVVMEYASGGDLRSLMDERGRIPSRMVAWIGARVADGLSYAHERGFVHGDIKPQNILLAGAGEPKIADFGIPTEIMRSCRVGTFTGIPRYAAPELRRGHLVPASDIYSLGVTLYHMAVGRPPFKGNRREMAQRHRDEAPGPPDRRVWVFRHLNNLILQCMEKDPSRRPEAAELEQKLRLISERQPSSPKPGIGCAGGGDGAVRSSEDLGRCSCPEIWEALLITPRGHHETPMRCVNC